MAIPSDVQKETEADLMLPSKVLSSVFGYDKFQGEQEQIIESLMGGENCCVLMPTGSGKSLCYQIPSICRKGTGVIISPLIALMQDQVIALKEIGVKAATLHSGLEYSELQKSLNDKNRPIGHDLYRT